MKKVKISPSLLSADFSCLEESIEAVRDAEMLHLDIMDGHFVPNISFGPCVIRKIRPITNQIFDTHLMISHPRDYIDDFVDCGSDMITVHAESFKDVDEIREAVSEINDRGIKSGLSINPPTEFETIKEVLEDLDLLLIMTVNPGFGGQGFMEEVVPKIEKASDYVQEHELDLEISVDGGISPKTAPSVVEAGADVLVAGSAIFGGDPEENLKKLRIST